MFAVKQVSEELDISVNKPKKRIVSRFLKGNSTQSFGFYDFIIVLSFIPIWVIFTGLAICLKRRIPVKWWELVGIDKKKIAKNIKKKGEIAPRAVKIVNIEPKQNIDILKY